MPAAAPTSPWPGWRAAIAAATTVAAAAAIAAGTPVPHGFTLAAPHPLQQAAAVAVLLTVAAGVWLRHPAGTGGLLAATIWLVTDTSALWPQLRPGPAELLLLAAALQWRRRPADDAPAAPAALPRAIWLLAAVPAGLAAAGHTDWAATTTQLVAIAAIGGCAWRWGSRPGAAALIVLLVGPTWPAPLLWAWANHPHHASLWASLAVLQAVGAGVALAAALQWAAAQEPLPQRPA